MSGELIFLDDESKSIFEFNIASRGVPSKNYDVILAEYSNALSDANAKINSMWDFGDHNWSEEGF